MPTVEVPRGQRVSPARVGTTQLPSGAFQAEARAAGQFGREIGAFGEKILALDKRIQAAEEQRQYSEGVLAYEEQLDTLASERLKDKDFSNHRPKFDTDHDSFVSPYLDTVKSKEAKDRLSLYYARQRSAQGTRIEADAYRRSVAQEKADRPRVTQQNVDLSFEDNKLAEKEWTESMDRLQRAGMITETGPDSLDARNRTRVMMKAQTVSQRFAVGAVEMLKSKSNMVESDIFTKDEVALLDSQDMRDLQQLAGKELSFQKAERKVAIEAEQEKQRQAILDKFLNRDFADIKQFINSQRALDVKEKELWMNKADNWAQQINSGKDITTDPRVEADLEKKAYDISTGANTREEVMNEIMDARYGKTPTIDDATFDSLSTTANTQHKTYQANAMTEAIDYGQTQLLSRGQIEIIAAAQVTEDEDFDTILKRLGAQRKLEEENLSQYTRAMTQWLESEIKAGRDPNDDDIYKESRKKMVHYRTKLKETVARSLIEGPFGKPGTSVKTGGETIGTVDDEGKLVLNENGIRRLLRIAGNDVVRAREIIAERGFKEPDEGEQSFGNRPDGTSKGSGFLGVLKLKGGGIATEYSVGVQLESRGGAETDIPTLVPTLTKKEIALMVNDIIPNRKPVPPTILQKAVDHANKRVRAGENVFAR